MIITFGELVLKRKTRTPIRKKIEEEIRPNIFWTNSFSSMVMESFPIKGLLFFILFFFYFIGFLFSSYTTHVSSTSHQSKIGDQRILTPSCERVYFIMVRARTKVQPKVGKDSGTNIFLNSIFYILVFNMRREDHEVVNLSLLYFCFLFY